MTFNIYDTPENTIRNWSKQLTSCTKGNFRVYSDVDGTLREWEKLLNRTNLVKTNQIFKLYDTNEKTLKEWKSQLNSVFLK